MRYRVYAYAYTNTHTHTHIWMCIYTFVCVYMHQGDSQQAVFLCLFCSAGSIHCGAVRGLVIVGGPWISGHLLSTCYVLALYLGLIVQ